MSQSSKIRKSVGGLDISNDNALKVQDDVIPQFITVTLHFDENSEDSTIFVADDTLEVTSIKESHTVAGSDAGSVNLTVTNCTGTEAPNAGTDTLQSTLDLKGTANTVLTGTLLTLLGFLLL